MTLLLRLVKPLRPAAPSPMPAPTTSRGAREPLRDGNASPEAQELRFPHTRKRELADSYRGQDSSAETFATNLR